MPRQNSSPSTPRRSARSQRTAMATRQRFFDLDRLHVSVRIGSARADMMYWGVLGERWWRNYLHVHSFFEACYVFGGHGVFSVLGKEEHVKAGDIFIAKPGETHEIVSSRRQPL